MDIWRRCREAEPFLILLTYLEFRLRALGLKDPHSSAPSYLSNLIHFCIPLLYATNTCLSALFVPDQSLKAVFHACTFQLAFLCQATILLSLKSISKNKEIQLFHQI